MATRLKAAVIGGGMIGAQMDAAAKAGRPQTHAGGYHNNHAFNLVAICDPDPSLWLGQWECPIYSSPTDLLAAEHPDVVSVCVPEQQQYEVLREVLDHPGIQAVVAEKPLADSFDKSLDIVEAYTQAGIPLLVNYTRRYSAMYQDMARCFRTGRERVVSASIRYAKGVWHNGSHALDLALLLFGKVARARSLSRSRDFYEDDPSVTAFLSLEYCPNLILQALDEQCYTLFEVDIFTDRRRYVISNDHREIQVFDVQDGVGIPEGRRLVPTEIHETDYEDCMSGLMINLHNVLLKKSDPLCTGRDALDSLKIAHELISNR